MHIPLVCTPSILDKLSAKHNVRLIEVEQCFLNSSGAYLEDDREEHRTDPATMWFVAETDKGRLLKVVFVERDGNIYIKSAFDASDNACRIYDEKANRRKND